MGRGAGLPEVVDLALSAGALGRCPPWGTGQLGPPALPACNLRSASPVPSPPSKNAPCPAHRLSRAPSDDRPPNCPPQHEAPLFIQASSLSAVPLAANGAGRFCFCPAITRPVSSGGAERGWAQLPPPGLLHQGDAGAGGGTGASCGGEKGETHPLAWGVPAGTDVARSHVLVAWCWCPRYQLKTAQKSPKMGKPFGAAQCRLRNTSDCRPFSSR